MQYFQNKKLIFKKARIYPTFVLINFIIEVSSILLTRLLISFFNVTILFDPIY